MKAINYSRIIGLVLMGFVFMFTIGCETQDPIGTNTVTDKDGNLYHTIKIGTQVWMVENLKTTKYNDGTTIQLVAGDSEWDALATPGFCWYNNDSASYKKTYGALYNWYAVNTGKLAPIGWHIPTDAEWTTLGNYISANLSTLGTVGKALASTTNWAIFTDSVAIGNNLAQNNTSGYDGLPAGYRSKGGKFDGLTYATGWWSSTDGGFSSVRYRAMYYHGSNLFSATYLKKDALSVRCIKDSQ